MKPNAWPMLFLMLLLADCATPPAPSVANWPPILTPTDSPSAPPSPLHLNATSAASFIEYCRALGEEDPWKESEILQMVSAPGYQTMIMHHRRMDPVVNTDALVRMLAAIQDGMPFATESARLDRIYRSYRSACNQTDVLMSRLEQWANSDMLERAVAQARAVLPAHTRLQATIYLLPDGYSHAYVVEERDAVVLDFLHPGLIESERFLAHELHHIGVRSLLPPPCQQAGLSEALEVLTSMVQEGAASYWINGWRASFSPADLGLVESFLRDSLSGRLSNIQTASRRERLVGGRYGPVYQVGNGMIATLEQEYGRDWVVSRLGDPVALMLAWQDLAPLELKFDPEILTLMQAAGKGSGCSPWLRSIP